VGGTIRQIDGGGRGDVCQKDGINGGEELKSRVYYTEKRKKKDSVINDTFMRKKS